MQWEKVFGTNMCLELSVNNSKQESIGSTKLLTFREL